MNDFNREELTQRIRDHLDGTLTPEAFAWLDAQLAANPGVADQFVEALDFECLLERFHAGELMENEARRLLVAIGLPIDRDEPAGAPPAEQASATQPSVASPILSLPSITTPLGLGGVTLALLVAMGALFFALRGRDQSAIINSPQVARVSSSNDAVWSGALIPDSKGWLPAGSVELQQGKAEIRFISGVVVALKAPVKFEAVSATEAKVEQGAIAARVDGKKTTFRIRTPAAQVVDLGTEFGISVAESGDTDVAVFDGKVDVSSQPRTGSDQTARAAGESSNSPRRLTVGEGLHVNREGQFSRIVTVTDDSFPSIARNLPTPSESSPPLIAGVSDTMREDSDSSKFYRIVSHGFGEEAPAYVDRNYEWNGIDEQGLPKMLVGADYIMPFNDDKDKTLEVTVTVSRPATVYVLFDDRGTPPAWLTSSFVNTGAKVGMDEDDHFGGNRARGSELKVGAGQSIDHFFSVWERKVTESGPVTLGPRGGARSGRAMYGIVVAPLATEPTKD